MTPTSFFNQFFERAFRPFFLGALVFAVLGMSLFAFHYPQAQQTFSEINLIQWHAHEMIFGYALATVAGFLLTAMVNWSKDTLASGKPLALVFIAWVLARMAYLTDAPWVWVALFDLVFSWGLFVLFTWPALRKKLWAQMGLASKFLLLALLNTAFYALAFSQLMAQNAAKNDQAWSFLEHFFKSFSVLLPLSLSQVLWLSLFIVLAINITMIRRVLPFFIEKSLQLPNKTDPLWMAWLNRFAMIGFLALMLLVVFWPTHPLIAWVAGLTALLFLQRGVYWHHRKLWRQPLLWPLFLSYSFITLGIALFAAPQLGLPNISLSLALHALSAGGIGLLCSAMLARISLGHTHRDIYQPPQQLSVRLASGSTFWILSIQNAFMLIALAAVGRVILPLIWPSFYVSWMTFAQWTWVLGFAILLILYARIYVTASARNPMNLP